MSQPLNWDDEGLDWAEDDPKMQELSELAIQEEIKPKLCICGKHTFSIDEIEMVSCCPVCFADSNGTKATNIQERRQLAQK